MLPMLLPSVKRCTRPSMRCVPVKTVEQHAALMLHRARDLLVRQRTQLINAIRAHLSEVGLVAAKGVDGLKSLPGVIAEARKPARRPEATSQALQVLAAQLQSLSDQTGVLERDIHVQHR